MPAVRTWSAFIEAVDDEVLFIALGHLHAVQVLNLVATSASGASRLTSKFGGCDCVAHRFAAKTLGAHAAAAAALAAAAATPDVCKPYSPYSGDPLAGLRVIASATPAAEAVQLALALASSTKDVKEGADGPSIVDGCHFLEQLFRMETRAAAAALTRRKSSFAKCSYQTVSTVAAADAALTVLLLDGNFLSNIMLACARAVRQSEKELDILIEGRPVEGLHKSYEVVAERRSAAEFLRDRLETTSVSASAKRELDLALGDLDDTITGYSKEGYEFICPKLTGGVSQINVPYAHWWIFAGRHCVYKIR
jgi:hypothetical protein